MFKKKIKLLFFIGLTLLVTACGASQVDKEEVLEKEIVVDDYGNEIKLDKRPEKIVSLSPSTTEILFALGLENEIVGVSSYSDYPKEALEKEIIGAFGDPNLEKIIDLAPDIVISSGGENLESKEILKNANIDMATFNSDSIDGVMGEIERIGKLTGKSQEAGKLIEEMEEKRAEVMEKAQQIENKKRVFYEIWHDPLTTAGKGSFMDELITLAGGDNVAGYMDTPYPEINVETLIKANPEIYLTTDDGSGKTIESIEARPGYLNIDAVKNKQVYILDANILSRPGPRIVQALEILYNTINQ